MGRFSPTGTDHRIAGNKTPGLIVMVALVSAIVSGARTGALHAQSPSPVPGVPVSKNEGSSRTTITADRLDVDSETRTAEFSGNVRAIQENMVITADRLKIFFRNKGSGDKRLAADEASIETIVASSKVTITFDDRIATADQAIYRADEKVLVLSGDNPRVIIGDNSITGTTITYHMTDGRITVEGNGDRRVNAVFYSGDNGTSVEENGKTVPP